MGRNIFWNDERDAALKRHFAAGLSYTRIAWEIQGEFKLKCTRNSAIGRARRMGLEGSGSTILQFKEKRVPIETIRHRRQEIISRAPAKPLLSREKMLELRCEPVTAKHLPLVDLSNRDCHYPYGDGPFTFCGNEVFLKSYCKTHHYITVGIKEG